MARKKDKQAQKDRKTLKAQAAPSPAPDAATADAQPPAKGKKR